MGTEQPGPSEAELGVEAAPDTEATLVPAVREQFPIATSPEAKKAAIDWAKVKQQLLVLKKTLEIAMMDPTVRDGAQPFARTTLNGILTAIDMIPGVGMTTWAADIAKLSDTDYPEKMKKYEREVIDAMKAGRNPNDVEKPVPSITNLTPEVHPAVNIIARVVGMSTGDIVPTYWYASLQQLKKDWPQLRAAGEQLKKIADAQAVVTQAESDAAKTFGVVIDVKDENPSQS